MKLLLSGRRRPPGQRQHTTYSCIIATSTSANEKPVFEFDRKPCVKMAMPVSRFGLSRLELKVLMSKRKEEAVAALEKFEGVEAIAQQLETNLKGGLSGAPQDLESRRSFYGANVLPRNPPKSFLSLCLDAIQDPTLIILIAAAIVSIALGVGVEERKVKIYS